MACEGGGFHDRTGSGHGAIALQVRLPQAAGRSPLDEPASVKGGVLSISLSRDCNGVTKDGAGWARARTGIRRGLQFR
jgi:hypothetical protein